MDYVIFASYGNDSIALIQWAHERGLKNVTVAYSDTGWAADWWPARVEKAEAWVRTLGFDPVRIESEGMVALTMRKKAWPRGGGGKYQFCTAALKEEPALQWLDGIDPEKDTVCMIGIRREESDNRATFPEWVEESEKHGDRSLHAPLVRHTEADRNTLLAKTPFEPLPHRSKECYPCVNTRKKEIAALPDEKIATILTAETLAGINSKGNPRVMFSPKRHKGAVGIIAVVKWARGDTEPEPELVGCDGGWCGA
jgi:3'-phosphoadenosine 5'-phosphosulfate sulfotransferase (PAPS reductase)/FAD synthetase